MTDAKTRRGRPIRFSLLTLMLVTAIVALSITVAMLYREVRPLRDEVARLRSEVGELHVEDPLKLHAIRVETDSELEWKWRVWIPAGTTYRLRAEGDGVPAEGFPSTGGTVYLRDEGEHVVRYLIRRDPRTGGWYGSLHTRSGSVGKDHQPWVEWSSRTSTTSGVGSSTRVYETDQRVEIIRHRVSQAASSANIEDPAAGFIVWLEPG